MRDCLPSTLAIYLLALLISVSCQPITPEPSYPEQRDSTPTASSLDLSIDVSIEATTVTIEATIPPPATPTALPTANIIHPSPTVVAPTIVASPTTRTGCRSVQQTAHVQPLFVVTSQSWSRPPSEPREIYTGYAGEPRLIHLGFDVEGSPEQLGALLDVLERRKVKTTMFILGSWAESHPEWIKEIGRRGHEFGNHLFSHANLRDLDATAIKNELIRTEDIVQGLTGKTTMPWMRPPFGSRTAESIQTAHEIGWTTVLWSGSSEDWQSGSSADTMCQTLLSTAFPGSILYSHTHHPEIAETVDRFIGEMQIQRYTFVPLSVILSGDPNLYLVSP